MRIPQNIWIGNVVCLAAQTLFVYVYELHRWNIIQIRHQVTHFTFLILSLSFFSLKIIIRLSIFVNGRLIIPTHHSQVYWVRIVIGSIRQSFKILFIFQILSVPQNERVFFGVSHHCLIFVEKYWKLLFIRLILLLILHNLIRKRCFLTRLQASTLAHSLLILPTILICCHGILLLLVLFLVELQYLYLLPLLPLLPHHHKLLTVHPRLTLEAVLLGLGLWLCFLVEGSRTTLETSFVV